MERNGYLNVKKMGNRLNNRVTAKRIWQVGGTMGVQYNIYKLKKANVNKDHFQT